MERFALQAAPLDPATGNTRTLHRWELPASSHLHASEMECHNILLALLNQFLGLTGMDERLAKAALGDLEHFSKGLSTTRCPFSGEKITLPEVLAALDQRSRIGTSELPVAHMEGHKHRVDNVAFFQAPPGLYRLRSLCDQSNLVTKVQTKAYLTDRRQTGDYQTNRELRWETHPQSPQFGPKRDCQFVEGKILAQVFEFSNAPTVEDTTDRQVISTFLGRPLDRGSFRCPISGLPIEYEQFIVSVSSPTHGRSEYQVGHLVPLSGDPGGHRAENTSWITELGNRVQGEDSRDHVVKEIFRMARYHKERLGLTWDEVESSGAAGQEREGD